MPIRSGSRPPAAKLRLSSSTASKMSRPAATAFSALYDCESPAPNTAINPSPKYLLTIPPCSSSTTCTVTRKKSFKISTISAGRETPARAVNDRMSTNITVISSSTPLSPGSRARICSAARSPTCNPNVCRNFSLSFPRNRVGRGAKLMDRFGNQPTDHERGAKTERDPNCADENGEPCCVGARRFRCEREKKERAYRTERCRDRPENAAPAERKRDHAGDEIRADIAKKNGKQSPMSRQLEKENRVRDRDETGNTK